MDRRTGLYSKAAQIIRSLPQERGTAEQMIAAAKKAGVKDAELAHARPPTGKITREELAQHFEQNLPKVNVTQYGENPRYLSLDENRRRLDLQKRATLPGGEPLTPEDQREYDRLNHRVMSSPNVVSTYDDETGEEGPADTEYGEYILPGGRDYRERLLQLETPRDPRDDIEKRLRKAEVMAGAWPEGHRARERYDEEAASLRQKLEGMPARQQMPPYQSSHWGSHPNVLAHIRLTDRETGPASSWDEAKKWVVPTMQKIADHMGATPADLGSGAAKYAVQNGLITPEEAATLTQLKGWQNEFTGKKGIVKRLLHVEELQSDWAQEGRDKGFNTGEATKAYQDHIADLKDRFRQKLSWMGDDAAIEDRMKNTLVSEMAYALGEGDKHKELGRAAADERGKVPQGPYVQNTQHWTDLALKNVLREAALGNYDGVVFTPGQAQADRYGLEKHVDKVMYDPGNRVLKAVKDGNSVVNRQDVGPEDLPSLIGHDVTKRLLHPDNTFNAGDPENQFHMLQGDDLKMGGEGMKGYYDDIVPKSVMRLARQHDPSIQPGEPVQLPQGYQGFHLPMTDQLKSSILDKGFPAFKRGGRVDDALAITRGFTKDGAGAMMRLKS